MGNDESKLESIDPSKLESPLARRLCDAAVRAESLVIRAAAGASAVRIEIGAGRLLAIESEGGGETFAQYLVRTGRIEGPALQAAQRYAEDRGVPLAVALERKGGLSRAQAVEARRDLFVERLRGALGSTPEILPDSVPDDEEGRDLLEVVVRAALLDARTQELVAYLLAPEHVVSPSGSYEAVSRLLEVDSLAGQTVQEIMAAGEQSTRALTVLLLTGAARVEASKRDAVAPPAPLAVDAIPDLLAGKGIGLIAVRESLEPSPDKGTARISSKPPPPPAESRMDGPRRVIGRLSLVPATPSAPPPLISDDGPTYERPLSTLDDPVAGLEDEIAAGGEALDPITRGTLLVRKARLLWERFGAVEEAARAAREAAAAMPSSREAMHEAVSGCMRAGDLPNAVAYLRVDLSLTQAPSDRVEVLRHLASVLERAGDRLAALEALQLAEQIDPDDLSTLRELASVSSAPQAAELWLRIARARARGDDADDALAAVRQALRLVPGHDKAIEVAVDVLLPRGRIEEAERVLRDAIAESGAAGRAALFRRMAELGRSAGRPELVAEACAQIVLRVPEDEWAHRELRGALTTLGRSGEVMQLLRAESRSDDPARRQRALEDELALCRELLAAAQEHGAAGPHAAEEAVHVASRLLALSPQNATALETVRTHLEASREFGTLCDLLARSTESRDWSADEPLVARLLEVATLAEEKLGAVHRALAAWERVGHIAPGHPGLDAAVSRLRGKVKLQDGLLELAEKEALTADLDRRLQALRKIAGLAKDNPASRAHAIESYREVLRYAPNDAGAMLALSRLYEGQDDAEGLAWLLRHRANTSPHRGEKIRLATRLAHVLHDDLGRLAEARTACLEVLALQPSHHEILFRLERIAIEAGESSWLADALSSRAEATTGSERADLLITVAGLCQSALGDDARAIATLEQVLAARPDDWRALRALARLYSRSDDSLPRARDAAERLLTMPAGRGDVRTLGLLAQIRERLGDAAGSREALRARVTLDPGDEATAGQLAERLLEGGEPAQAADVIEKLYRSDMDAAVLRDLTRKAVDALLTVSEERERAEALISRFLERISPRDSALARRAAESAHAREDDIAAACYVERALVGAELAERSELLRLAADRWESVDDLAAATRCRVRLLRLTPNDAGVLDALERTYARVGDAARLIAVLEVRLAGAVDRDERHGLYAKLAAAARDLAGDPDRALAYLGRSAREAPGEQRSLESIQGMLFKLGRFEELAAHLEARAEGAVSLTDQALFFRQAAMVRDQHLSDLPGAIRAAQCAVMALGSDGDALHELERLALRHADVKTMAEVYDHLARKSAGAHGERAIRYRAGRFLEGMGLKTEALSEYQRSFALDPQVGAALRAIERIATEVALYEPVVEAYKMLADVAPDPGSRASALRKAAETAEVGLVDREQALELLLAAYSSYGDAELELDMRRVAREIARDSEEAAPAAFLRVKAAFEKRASGAIDAEDRSLWIRKIARIDAEDRLDPRAALDALLEACSAAPEAEGLADDVERLAAALGPRAWEEVGQVYERVIAECLDPDLASDYRMRLARIDNDHLGGLRVRSELRWVVVQGGPRAAEAFSQLRTHLQTAGATLDLVQLLESTLPSLAPEGRVARTLEAADLLERELHDPAGALALCDQTRTALGQATPALREAIVRLAQAAGDAARMDALLEEDATAQGTDPAAIPLWLRLAGVREELGQPARALAAYREVLAIDPRAREAQEGAERTARAGGAIEALEEVLDLRARHSVGPERTQAIMQEATVMRDAGHRAQSSRVLEEALAVGYDDALAAMLCENLEADHDHEALARWLQARIQHASDEARADLRTRRAELVGEHLGRPAEARADLIALLEENPGHLAALEMMVEIDGGLGDVPSAVHFAERASTACPEPARAAELLCRAGAMLAATGDEEGAERRFRAALQVFPEDVFALRALVQFVERRRDLASSLEYHLKLADLDPAQRTTHLFAAAQAAADTGDESTALRLVVQARALDPISGPPAALHATLLAGSEAFQTPQGAAAAAATLMPALPTPDPGSGSIIRFVVADCRARQGDLTGAIALLEAGRAGPGDPLLALGLAECLRQRGDAAGALAQYEIALAHPSWHRFRATADVTLSAGLAAASLGVPDRARALLSGAMTLDPALAPRAHRALADLALQRGELGDAALELRQLADVLTGTARGAALRELGETLARGSGDDAAATAFLEESLCAVDAASVDAGKALDALLEIALRRGEWAHVEKLVERMLSRGAEGKARAALHLIGARAAATRSDRDAELGQLQAARASDPENEEAQAALEALLSARGDHTALLKELEARMRGTTGVDRAALLVRLGDVKREGLADFVGASSAYEEAARIGSKDGQARLATILSGDPDRVFDAIALYRKVVETDPGNVEALRSLRRLYGEIGASHESNGVGSLLRLFDPSIAVEAPPSLDDIREPPEGVLAALTPPGLSSAAAVLALVWDSAMHLFRHDLADFGIKAKDRISPLEETQLARTFASSIRLLGLPRTGLFVRAFSQDSIEIVATHPPSLVVSADLKAEHPGERFRIGRAVESTRPGHILIATMQAPRAKDLIDSIRAAFGPAESVTAGTLSREAKALAGELWKTIPPRTQRQLQELVAGHPEISDFTKIAGLAQRAAARAGLVVCGDAAAAIRILASEDPRLRELPIGTPAGFTEAVGISAELADLVAFAISDPYLSLRWRAESTGARSR